MSDLTALSNRLDRKLLQCAAIIETPKDSRNKFDYDPESGLFKLGGLLPAGMMFPFDFGFIPSTVAPDGDPLDVMVLMDEPAHVGCLLDVRLVGVIEAEQMEDKKKKEANHRLLAVSIHSYSHENITSVKQMNKSILDQIEAFFVSYNAQRGKKFKVTGLGGPQRALAILLDAMKSFGKNKD